MSSSSTRPPARRGPSGAWGRLRQPQIDPLEVYGLPSKDLKTQETYFERIVARYMKFCASHQSGETLEASFHTLSISGSSSPTPPAASQDAKTQHHATTQEAPQEMGIILMAMRKLREALVSSHRVDAFAQRVYTFQIRAAILCKHLETYHPALQYLLYKIHPRTPLSRPELQEFAIYLIFDIACRQGEFVEAFRLRRGFKVKDRKVDAVLKALVHDDWVLFWRTRRAVDGYQRCLMGWAEDGVRLHALKCLGRSYMMADKAYVEESAERSWEELVERDKVGWVLREDGVVVVRKPKGT
ncbi:hypothetical protein E4T38_07565 [Aureobasidium subglaciale]|nr:hypothetical protein E4T38_07565 [Aureobasidium subglaciale]KAI5217175.1 hypothetical protein E4T40_07522 [Aureobasidium subglaciale]KAI5220503.1 hypothetical protein E4T41_07491 [Aureobasidium subglaciale]KAI5258301.1 hypothetical protein E4T46_07468 [Aureobasidium subglaciale]